MSCPVCKSNNIILQKVIQSTGKDHLYCFCQNCGQNKAVSRELCLEYNNMISIPYLEAKEKIGLKTKPLSNISIKQKTIKPSIINPVEVKKDNNGKYIDSKLEGLDYHIYCDGVCEPNPGESGFGIVVYENNKLHKLFYGGYKIQGTNQIAELQGLFAALKLAEKIILKNKSIQILTDSTYAINCITVWSYQWKMKSWIKSKTKPIKNLEIIKNAHFLYDSIKDKVIVSHIKGHYGFEGNELADKMSELSVNNKSTQICEYLDSKDVSEIMKIKTHR